MLGWNGKWVSQNQHTTMLICSALNRASLSFWPPRLIQGILYIYAVVRTTAGPLQKEQSAFIITTERYCLKLHEGLPSKGEYCHRENKLLETRPLLIPVHHCYPHTGCWSPHFKPGPGDVFCFKQVNTFRAAKGLCERIRLLLCFLYLCLPLCEMADFRKKSLKTLLTDSWLNPGCSSSSVLLTLFPKFLRYGLWIFLLYKVLGYVQFW